MCEMAFAARQGVTLNVDLLVTEGWRCKGVGTALMDVLIAAAKAEGLHGISWQVLEWNEPALKFYETLGAHIMDEWETMRLMEPALSRLASAEIPESVADTKGSAKK